MAEKILLEAGTNEMELLIFRLARTWFGINVAKVREIVNRGNAIPIPHSPPEIEGSFKLREEVLSLVNLGRFLGMEGEETTAGKGLIIVVEFNRMRCGVLVDAVEVIHRLRWDEIEPPPALLSTGGVPVTGIAHVGERIVQIADFETIIGNLFGTPNADYPEAVTEPGEERAETRILLADDSPMIRGAVERILRGAGYQNLTLCSDGQEAWDTIQAERQERPKPFDLVLTDIEMPRMDGLHLTSLIKQDVEFKERIPVVIFSSLISEDNQKKGESVGADAQVVKLQGGTLLEAAQKCLEHYAAAP